MTSLLQSARRPDLEAGLPVSFRGVRRAFPDGTLALEALDLEIAAGSFVALVGPSGCGKSTLLRLVAGLDVPQAGRVDTAAGTSTDAEGPPIAFVFQDAHLLPWRDVLDNVALPLRLGGCPRAERRRRALEALARVGLADAASKRPAELSGGMRMRVSLARALVTRPRLLLLDEPFGALDELTRHRLDEALRTLWRDTGMTVLLVTHAISEAAWLAQRVVVLSPRPAHIVLDTTIGLPIDRDPALRTEPAFAREVQRLYRALQGGGA